ncbi:MAG: ATP-binding protein [Candidatus Thermoplasmatota archaeon]|nr:ATP-binding protein [Candidatus Thermoplasmatota archaeon]MDP7265092.1 ATP-binding protein [Candidatus Thermoplasmatota archaeon]
MFVNRVEEIKAISKRLDSDNFEFFILYGRRRIGKTRLILECVREREHIYYFATESANIRHFKDHCKKSIPDMAYAADDWEAIFNLLRDRIVIIDEFPNMIKEFPGIISLFQRIIDTQLSKTRTKLILLGSSISMMGQNILSYKSPLYGRKTGVIKLGPMDFKDIRSFFPEAGWYELCEIFGLCDGVPYYLEKMRDSFWEWLQEEVSGVDSFLSYEIDFLMKYEFENFVTYKKILEAIANGKNTPVEIRNYLGMRHSDITPYLRNLMEVEFIKREIPVTEGERSRMGRYFLKDNFLSFWFRFIYPNLSGIGEKLFSVEDIREDHNAYVGRVFEQIAKQFVLELNRKKMLPFGIKKLGRWWRKGEEIDLIGMNEREKKALFMEVKWRDLKAGEADKIISKLKRKSVQTSMNGYEKHYGIIAKGTEKKGTLIFDLMDFDRVF